MDNRQLSLQLACDRFKNFGNQSPDIIIDMASKFYDYLIQDTASDTLNVSAPKRPPGRPPGKKGK